MRGMIPKNDLIRIIADFNLSSDGYNGVLFTVHSSCIVYFLKRSTLYSLVSSVYHQERNSTSIVQEYS